MISIVVSIYNGEQWLRRCIDSLLAQTSEDYELILVDDGSRDGSGAICDEYSQNHDRVRVIHKQNEGLSMARRTGWLAAQGEYIMFLDCDDYVSPHLVERMRQATEEKPDLILCDFTLVDEAGKQTHRQINLPGQLLEAQDLDAYAAASIAAGWDGVKEPYLAGFVWLRCIRRSVIREEMFVSERLCYTEDVLFNLVLSRHIRSFAYIGEPLYYYCINPTSLTNRYRETMWQMLCYRRAWIAEFCTREELWPLAQERFDHSCWVELQMACRNACLLPDGTQAVRQLRLIRNTSDTPEVLRIAAGKFHTFSIGEKLMWLLIRLRLFRVYYHLTRMRRCG